MKFTKLSLPVIAIGLFFFISGCSNMSSQDKTLIENINAKYYSVTNQDVNKIVFEYTSNKFTNLIETIQTQEVRILMSKINFIVSWRPYGRIIINIENEPKFDKSDANAGVRQMMGGMKKEITGLFMMLTPVMTEMISDKGAKKLNITQKGNNKIIDIEYSKNILIRHTFNKSNELLLKSEIFRNNKKFAVSTYKFKNYKDFYLLINLETDLIGENVLKSKLDIKYTKKNELLIPHEMNFESTISDRRRRDKVQLTPIDIF